MIIKAYNEKHPYLVFIDLEFNNRDLVQFAGLLFKRIDDGVYQLMRSCNQYVTTRVCFPFMEYTNITNNFLEANGITLKDLKIILFEDFLDGIDFEDLLIISHGLKNDRLTLTANGINLSSWTTPAGELKSIDGYCTFNNAKRILKRDGHLTAADISQECGYFLHQAHNAYNDVWSEVAIFTYLKKLEMQQNELKES